MPNYKVVFSDNSDHLEHRSSKAISRTIYVSQEYLDELKSNSSYSDSKVAKYMAAKIAFNNEGLSESDDGWRAEMSVGQEIKTGRYKGLKPVRITVHFDDSVKHSDFLAHHGIHGQKWGIRRFQNPDGTLTEAGKKRYGANSAGEISSAKGLQRRLNDVDKSIARNTYDASKALNKAGKKMGFSSGEKNTKKLMEAQKNIEAGKAETEELLKKISENGYTSLTIPTRRAVGSKGEAVARSILATGILNAALLPLGRIGAMVSVPTVSGKNYRVKDIQKKAKGKPTIAMLTEDEAKKAGLGESTRITGKEEAELWKALAKQYEEEEKRKRS